MKTKDTSQKRRRDESPKRPKNSILGLLDASNERKPLEVVPEHIEYNPQDFSRDFIKDYKALNSAVLYDNIDAVKAMGFEGFCNQYRKCLVQRCDDNSKSVLYHALWVNDAQASGGDNRLNIDMLKLLMSTTFTQNEYNLYTNIHNKKITIKAKYQSTTGLIHVEGITDIAMEGNVSVYYVSYDVGSEGQILNYIKSPRPDVRIPQHEGGCIIS